MACRFANEATTAFIFWLIICEALSIWDKSGSFDLVARARSEIIMKSACFTY
jgi:hypothetical protein